MSTMAEKEFNFFVLSKMKDNKDIRVWIFWVFFNDAWMSDRPVLPKWEKVLTQSYKVVSAQILMNSTELQTQSQP
jgi:hypothetical protein